MSTTLDLGRRIPSIPRGMVWMAALSGVVTSAALATPAVEERLSGTAETIHQEVTFHASPTSVYEALTQTRSFDAITRQSGVLGANPSFGGAPTSISREVGGPFVLFGGYIIGRNIELVPDRRIVQAWRVIEWEPGRYSVASFQLSASGTGTRLVFDHTGFPVGQSKHLAEGWRSHYWTPIAAYLDSIDTHSGRRGRP